MPTSRGHVLDQLSAFLDGDLGEAAAARVRLHLTACAACAGAAADLRAITRAARTLDKPEPPATLWPAIQGELARLEGRPTVLRWRFFAFGTLAGAALASLIVWAGVRRADPRAAVVSSTGAPAGTVSPAVHQPPVDPLLEEAEAEFAGAAAAYERAIEKLRTLLARQEPSWSADARAFYADRLTRLDEAIARSRELARRRPGDSAGNEMLFAAYQEKIQFLAAAVHRGAPGSGGGGP